MDFGIEEDKSNYAGRRPIQEDLERFPVLLDAFKHNYFSWAGGDSNGKTPIDSFSWSATPQGRSFWMHINAWDFKGAYSILPEYFKLSGNPAYANGLWTRKK